MFYSESLVDAVVREFFATDFGDSRFRCLIHVTATNTECGIILEGPGINLLRHVQYLHQDIYGLISDSLTDAILKEMFAYEFGNGLFRCMIQLGEVGTECGIRVEGPSCNLLQHLQNTHPDIHSQLSHMLDYQRSSLLLSPSGSASQNCELTCYI